MERSKVLFVQPVEIALEVIVNFHQSQNPGFIGLQIPVGPMLGLQSLTLDLLAQQGADLAPRFQFRFEKLMHDFGWKHAIASQRHKLIPIDGWKAD